MKKGFFIFLIILGIGVWTVSAKEKQKNAVSQPTTTPVKAKTLGSQSIAFSVPTLLEIPKIGVSASVESVGMDSQGRMDIPKKDENVAWYNLGYKPGAAGNAVMAGHLDTKTGAPAVFWNLSKLSEGDEITVTEEGGQKVSFIVEKVVNYPYDAFPLQKVFGSSSVARLNLITCEGTWNSATHNYSHRTVVYAVKQ